MTVTEVSHTIRASELKHGRYRGSFEVCGDWRRRFGLGRLLEIRQIDSEQILLRVFVQAGANPPPLEVQWDNPRYRCRMMELHHEPNSGRNYLEVTFGRARRTVIPITIRLA